MSEEETTAVTTEIKERLSHVGSSHVPSECCMFRVNGPLRMENKKAYEPSTVSIGPYHHGNKELNWMEDHKIWYFQQLLKRRNETDDVHVVDTYMNAMRDLGKRARNCYAQPYEQLDDAQFTKMLLLDGIFIIEFCRKSKHIHVRNADPNYRIVQTGTIGMCVMRDLVLVENQLPFFVLNKLFEMTKDENHPEERDISFFKVALHALGAILPVPENSPAIDEGDTDIIHLLNLGHKCCFASVQPVANGHVSRVENNKMDVKLIHRTIELQEAGIKIKVAERSTHLFDIKFENGVLTIPPLKVNDETESVFRNMIAYEHFPSYQKTQHVTNYMTFLHCLINTSKDVETLRKAEIICNWLGKDEAVSTIISKLGINVHLVHSDFRYKELFNQVNKHCGQRQNIWFEKLKRDYFNSPWSIISSIAAFVLLLLTFTNTTFSVLHFVFRKQKDKKN